MPFLEQHLTCQSIERHGSLADLVRSTEDFPDFTREGERDLVANTESPPAMRSHQARDCRERVGVIGNDPERIPIDQHWHCALSYQGDQVCKEECPTATN